MNNESVLAKFDERWAGSTDDARKIKEIILSALLAKDTQIAEAENRGWNRATDVIAKAMDDGRNLEEAWERLESARKA